MEQEQWRPVPGWESRYEVSDHGRVRSVGPRGRVRAGHVRSPTGQTHCKHGHEFTEANTYRPPSNPKIRQCRECGRLHHANRRRASA